MTHSEKTQATALRSIADMRTTMLDFAKLLADAEDGTTPEIPQSLLCSLALGFHTQLAGVEHIIKDLVRDHATMETQLRNALKECDEAYGTELKHIELIEAIEKEQRRPRAKRRTVGQIRAALED